MSTRPNTIGNILAQNTGYTESTSKKLNEKARAIREKVAQARKKRSPKFKQNFVSPPEQRILLHKDFFLKAAQNLYTHHQNVRTARSKLGRTGEIVCIESFNVQRQGKEKAISQQKIPTLDKDQVFFKPTLTHIA